MEIGVTGGVEDGVDNSNADKELQPAPVSCRRRCGSPEKRDPGGSIQFRSICSFLSFLVVYDVPSKAATKLRSNCTPLMGKASQEKLYSTPEDVWNVYKALNPISHMFTIAAAFGNVHGVYKPGNVEAQEYVRQKIKESTGKDVERQWAYWEGLLKFYKNKEGAFLRAWF
eukprot:Skav200417  [mRNA]  locus=scaffold5579:6321:12073:- [translate_table: standard]